MEHFLDLDSCSEDLLFSLGLSLRGPIYIVALPGRENLILRKSRAGGVVQALKNLLLNTKP
jgi:hypothetical protein